MNFKQFDTPPSRNFVRRLSRVGGFLQSVNSTSALEIKTSTIPSSESPPVTSINYSLPVVDVKDCTAAFRRIHADTLRGLMTSLPTDEFLKRFMLVDCRYPYEYNGGHIQHAVNLFDTSLCERFFFSETENTNRIPIFYCEYSQTRGPEMAGALRSVDRVRNIDHYPNVTFGEIYVLDQGYRGFFHSNTEEAHKALCEPSEYVQMDDKLFGHELKKYTVHKRKMPVMLTPESTDVPKETLYRPPSRRGLFGTPTLPPHDAFAVPVNEEHEELNISSDWSPELQPQRLTFS